MAKADPFENLSPQKQILLKRMLMKKGVSGLELPVLPTEPGESPAVSFAQERVWFIEQLGGLDATYNVSVIARLRGDLDVRALRLAFSEVVRRHAAVRTRFLAHAEALVAMIDEPWPFEIDVTELDEPAAREAVRRDSARRFDLSRDHLLRASLYRLRKSEHQSEHLIAFVMHHIVSDDWSMEILVRDLSRCYAAFTAGRTSPLEALPVQFADYARWQREALAGETLAAQSGYWKRHLASAPPATELPVDHPRPATQGFRGGVHRAILPPALVGALHTIARRESATLYMVLFAAFNVVVSRWSGQEDLVLGSPIANRTRREVEEMIGYFVNMLALRTDVSGDPTFTTLLHRVRETLTEAFAHQHLPFEKVLDALRPPRDSSRQPVFQILVNNTHKLPSTLRFGDVEAEILPHDDDVGAKFDLTLYIDEFPMHIALRFNYNAQLYESATMMRLACHFETLLGQIASRPDARLSELSMIGETERAHRRENPEDATRARDAVPFRHRPTGEMPPPAYASLANAPSLIAALRLCIDRQPERPAVVDTDPNGGASVWTYADLAREAGRVVTRLTATDGMRHEPVGLLMTSRAAFAAAVIGTLGANRFYLPLSANDPPSRLAAVLQDAGCRHVIASRENVERLASLHAIEVICIDDLIHDTTITPARLRDRSPDSLAYVLYTSGTTGVPKGVAQSDRNVLAHVAVYADAMQLGPSDRMTLLASSTSDAAVKNLFGALLTGGALYPWDVRRLGTEGLQCWLVEHDLTIWHSTPSLLRQALHGFDAPVGLRWVALGGEPIRASDVALIFERAGTDCQILRGLSQTECSTAIQQLSARGDWIDLRPGAAGRAAPGVEIVLLDAHGNPADVHGEIAIRSARIALGYWNRPALTAERFPPDPEGNGARLYRTGDLARWRADGTLQYLGRADLQVKVRGFRIEPGEVEARLLRCEGVRAAVAVARSDAQGETRLVAYVAAREGERPTPAAMRAALVADLPDYMVPSAFVVLDALPLTANGKLDRRALPEPDAGALSVSEFEAPAGEVETRIAEVWARLLGVERVGRADDFFALGGHSLLATRVMSQLRSAWGIDVPLRTLFEATTLAGFAARVGTPLAESRAADATRHDLAPIEAVPRDMPLPLSFAQQRFWFIERMQPGSGMYNIPVALRLDGELDREAFATTLTELVRRHEVLRTRFETVDGEPALHIDAAPERVEIGFVDLTQHDDAEQEALRLAAEEAAAPFDLARGPLLRARLIQVAQNRHLALFTVHHIATDGWSMNALVREVIVLYPAMLAGRQPSLPMPVLQYADFACWQRRMLVGDALTKQIDYWRMALDGAPALLTLPTDRARAPYQDGRGAKLPVAFDAALVARLDALGLRHGATRFMVLLSAFALLLSRFSSQDDVCIGTPVANRTRSELEDMLGCFVNTLVLRVRLVPEMRFEALLDQVRETALSAFSNQDVPFEQLVEQLQPRRDPGHAPLFQAMFVMQNMEIDTLVMPGLEITVVDGLHQSSKFDLTLRLADAKQGALRGELEYATALFDAATMKRLLAALQTLLTAIVDAPAQPLRALGVVSDVERDRLLALGRSGTTVPARDLLLNEGFEQRARSAPVAEALSFGEQRVDYVTLNARANRLARHLRARGVTTDTRVALCCERGVEMIVAILAVLKAGGAYVPIDPAYPDARIAFTLHDSAPCVVLADEAGAARLAGIESTLSAPVLRLDEPQAWAHEAGNDLGRAPGAGPSALAYVIYTSGSTGTPKGVMVTHGNALRLFDATQALYEFTRDDVWTLFHSFAFDFSVWEIWGALLHGGRLVIVPWETARSARQLHALLASERVTVLNQTPGAFYRLIEADAQHVDAAPLSLRKVIFGGEALSVPALQPWRARHGDKPALTNMYGITETTVHVTHWGIQDGETASVIGCAIDDLGTYVLDASGEPVPQGVAGELYVSGAGLARGYLNRAALTAERFVPDPFGAPGTRMYRTGDVVSYRANGQLVYLGRQDEQIKLRGFRIEPGEIAARLRECDGVRAAAVIARRDGDGETRLVAYWVASGEAEADEPTPTRLRAALAASLPDYMVPSAFVRLDALPLTANGKLDRRALPEPGADASAVSVFAAPEGEAEMLIAKVWENLLGVERVGRTDDFFALGGHSLLVTRAIATLEAALGAEIPLRTLFEAPTLAAFAARVDERLADTRIPALAGPIPRAPRDGALPLSFAQQRLWFIDRMQPGGTAYHISSALELNGALERKALTSAIHELVRRHEVLRTRFEVEAGEPMQVIGAAPSTTTVPLLDLTLVRDAEGHALQAAQREAARPFDLARGPLLRSRLVRLSPTRHILLFVVHHIAADGWSMGVLVKELAALYAAYAAGEPSPLATPELQYADFAHWQRAYFDAERLQAQLDYWRAALAGAPAVLTLPTDHARLAVQDMRGARVPLTIDAPLAGALDELARAHGATLFMVLAAAFSAVLARHAGQDDICLGTPVANRRRAEQAEMVGCFVNTLVLRSRIDPSHSFEQLLAQMRETALGAFAHQDLPFEQLVGQLAAQRDPAYSPLFQAMLVLQNMELAVPVLGDLAVVPLTSLATGAKYDLTLGVTEQDDGSLRGELEYATALFSEDTARRLAAHVATLLAAVAARPSQRIGTLALMGAVEHAETLARGHGGAPDYPRDATLGELFDAQVARTPEAIALRYEDTVLSYGEVDARANRLAHTLRALFVPGEEPVVALCLTRSIEMVVTLLAIVKSGAAYLPLDPSHPPQRLAAMLEDAKALAVVTHDATRAVFDTWPVAVVDADDAHHAHQPATTPRDVASYADGLAYVIYTSGSTGLPKGVGVTHRNVSRLACNIDYATIDPATRVLQLAPVAFDASTFEIWGTLLNGACLVVAPRGPLTLADIARVIVNGRIDVIWLTAALFNQMVDHHVAALAGVRDVLAGGEALSSAHVARFLAACPSSRLVNGYGPTENTTFSCCHLLRAEDAASGGIPLGLPIGHTQAYVLDAQGELLPQGMVGELYLGGDGLARGYFGRADLTAAQFVPHPFAHGDRLYRSGDRARLRTDGRIEYLGRLDTQIKLNGFRIELGEVEAALCAQPGVLGATAVVHDGPNGQRRLVAWLESANEIDAQALRVLLRQRLPEFMVPSLLMRIEHLPLTPNGKLDVRALPLPTDWPSGHGKVAPRNPIEELVAGFWAEVTGVADPGVTDNFFEAGGHSLLATQLIARLHMEIGIELPLRIVFEAPTIEGLAAALEAAMVAAMDAEPVATTAETS